MATLDPARTALSSANASVSLSAPPTGLTLPESRWYTTGTANRPGRLVGTGTSTPTRVSLAPGEALIRRTSGGATLNDVFAAKVNDYQNLQALQQRQSERQTAAAGLVESTYGGAVEGARGRALESRDYVRSVLANQAAGAEARTNETRQAAGNLGPLAQRYGDEAFALAQQQRAEALQDVTQRGEDLLARYKDTTAAAIQSQREAIMGPEIVRRERENIIRTEQEAGRDPTAALRAYDSDRKGRLGSLAAQIAVAWNDTKAKLNVATNEAINSMRGLQDQLTVQAKLEGGKLALAGATAGIERQQVADQLLDTMSQFRVAQEAENEQRFLMMQNVADQLEVAGAESLSSLLRSMPDYFLPLAPLVGDLAALTDTLTEPERAPWGGSSSHTSSSGNLGPTSLMQPVVAQTVGGASYPRGLHANYGQNYRNALATAQANSALSGVKMGVTAGGVTNRGAGAILGLPRRDDPGLSLFDTLAPQLDPFASDRYQSPYSAYAAPAI